MSWLEEAKRRVRRQGKLTPQRLKLLEVLAELGPRHPSLNDILERVREEFPTTSFSTLYSNVGWLEEIGLVRVFHHRGEARVEVNMRPHINIVRGDEIIDYEDEEIVRELERRLGSAVLLVNVFVGRSRKA